MVELDKVMLCEYQGKEKLQVLSPTFSFLIAFRKVPYFGDSCCIKRSCLKSIHLSPQQHLNGLFRVAPSNRTVISIL